MDNDTDTYEIYLNKVSYNEGKELLNSNYEYENEIGQGAYGYVMCGYRKSDHCSVAIKVLPETLIKDWYHSKTLEMDIPMEVLLMSLVAHIDGVITIFECYHDKQESKWYIVMERFTKSIDLFEFICKMGLLEESLACYIFYQLTTTVIDCHLRGVLHRDIKEENIIIETNSKKIWLIDFGSGGIMNDDNHYEYTGTTQYAPPEWLKHGHYRGCQLESWSLGIVLYSMVCGSIPFEDEKEILTSTIRFPRNISKNCKDLILKCLERNPDNRIHPFEIITHPWINTTLNNYDSGHGSFDEAFLEASNTRRCSCSCADNAAILNKDDHLNTKATIETIEYDSDCIKEIDPDGHFRVFSKSLSPDMDRKKRSVSPTFSKLTDKITLENKSTSEMYLNLKQSEMHLFEKLSKILTDKDCGYDEDIDDDFKVEDDLVVV